MNSEIGPVSVEGQVNLVSPVEFNLKTPTARFKCNDTLVELNIVDFVENVCTVSIPEKISDDDAFILLMDNDQVVAAASYNAALKGNNYLFLSASCLGNYVLIELKGKGVTAKDVYAALKVSDVQRSYEELAAVYQASGYQIDDVASGLNNHFYMQSLQSSPSFDGLADQAHFAYHPPVESAKGKMLLARANKTPADHALQVLEIASKIPFLKTYAGPATGVFKTVGGLFGLFSKELSLHDVMQKLQKLEKKLDNLVNDFKVFVEEYRKDQSTESIQHIQEHRHGINSIHQQLLNELGRYGSDISGFIGGKKLYRSKRINKLAKILSAGALTDIRSHADALKVDKSTGYLPKFFSDVKAVYILQIKNAKPDDDLLAIYGEYNGALMAQYNLVVIALAQALFLELTALYLKLEHHAEVFPAGDYGTPLVGSGNFQKMSAHLTKQFDNAIENHTEKLNSHLVPIDLIFDEKESNAELDFSERVVHEHGFRNPLPTHLPVLFATRQAMGVYNESKKQIEFYANDIEGTISTTTCSSVVYQGCGSSEKSCKDREGTKLSVSDLTAGTEVIIQPTDGNSAFRGINYSFRVNNNTCSPVILTKEQVKAIQTRACVLFDNCV
jgi:hypothetical protein